MVKLELPPVPVELNDELIISLTSLFKLDGDDVWNKKFIREAVLSFSFNKCSYSECKLDEESKYMEVDHFLPKKHFPDYVLKWGNLLPSSKKSNTTKGELNTEEFPIINPLTVFPKAHLFIKNFRYYPRNGDAVGQRTIDFTAINDRKHFVKKRAEIGLYVLEIIEDLLIELKDLLQGNLLNKSKTTRLLNKYKNLLDQANRTEEYSASISTTILNDNYNTEIIELLKSHELWDEELKELFDEINYCALPA